MGHNKLIVSLLAVAAGLMVITGVIFGVETVAKGNLDQARQIATRLQASAAGPSVPTSKAPVSSTSAPTSSTINRPATATTSATTAAPATPPTSAAGSAVRVHAAAGATGTTGTTATTATSGTKAPTKAAPVVSSVAPIIQPTSAEVQQAITAVHDAIPFFTPTPAEIASSGVQVCTALNGGATLAQVQAAALNMAGAGSYAAYIPSSYTQVAIQTLVALYCPGNAAKVA